VRCQTARDCEESAGTTRVYFSIAPSIVLQRDQCADECLLRVNRCRVLLQRARSGAGAAYASS
jgi:hypothetical protein